MGVAYLNDSDKLSIIKALHWGWVIQTTMGAEAGICLFVIGRKEQV